MNTTPRVLPAGTRVCPGNLGICGGPLFPEDERLICIAGHSFRTVTPLPRVTAQQEARPGGGPRHGGQRMG